jgi:hypothetical protein
MPVWAINCQKALPHKQERDSNSMVMFLILQAPPRFGKDGLSSHTPGHSMTDSLFVA